MAIAARRYFRHYYEHRTVFDEQTILGSLSPELQGKIVGHILERNVGRLPLFKRLSPSFKRAVFVFLKPVSFEAGDLIFNKGTESESLHFLLEGTVTVMSTFEDKPEFSLRGPPFNERIRLDCDDKAARVTKWEGCLGETALIGSRRLATTVAHTRCQTLALEKSSV